MRPLTCILVLSLAGCAGKPTSSALPGIPAEQIAADYDENEVSAAKKYEGKVLVVRGKVKEVQKGLVVLAGPERSIREVRCQFSSEAEDDLARLRRNDLVLIEGKMIGETSVSNDPHMTDCRIKPPS